MEFLFELLGESFFFLVELIIESDRVPKWIRYLIIGLLLGLPLILLCYAIICASDLILGILLTVCALALATLLIYFIWNIHRSGILRPARKEDLPEILKMYRSVLGKPGCHWTISYPNEATLHEDFSTGHLFVLWRGKHRIGAGSIVPKNELDDLSCWQYRENARELARIVIACQYQGKGYGKHLVRKLCHKLDTSKAKAVHILVSVQNNHAKNLYRECGFTCKGPCHRYDHDYYAYERKL